MGYGGQPCVAPDLNFMYEGGRAYITGMEQFTTKGAFEKEMELRFH